MAAFVGDWLRTTCERYGRRLVFVVKMPLCRLFYANGRMTADVNKAANNSTCLLSVLLEHEKCGCKMRGWHKAAVACRSPNDRIGAGQNTRRSGLCWGGVQHLLHIRNIGEGIRTCYVCPCCKPT